MATHAKTFTDSLNSVSIVNVYYGETSPGSKRKAASMDEAPRVQHINMLFDVSGSMQHLYERGVPFTRMEKVTYIAEKLWGAALASQEDAGKTQLRVEYSAFDDSLYTYPEDTYDNVFGSQDFFRKGGTEMCKALYELKPSFDETILLVVTDGQSSDFDDYSDNDFVKLSPALAQWAKVYFIGIGGSDTDQLQALSRATPQSIFMAVKGDNLSTVVESIVEGAQNTIARVPLEIQYTDRETKVTAAEKIAYKFGVVQGKPESVVVFGTPTVVAVDGVILVDNDAVLPKDLSPREKECMAAALLAKVCANPDKEKADLLSQTLMGVFEGDIENPVLLNTLSKFFDLMAVIMGGNPHARGSSRGGGGGGRILSCAVSRINSQSLGADLDDDDYANPADDASIEEITQMARTMSYAGRVQSLSAEMDKLWRQRAASDAA
jgi:hypothetical protein